MERVNPVLECILDVEAALLSGESIRSGLIYFIKSSTSRDLQRQCKSFLIAYENGQDISKFNKNIKSDLKMSLFHLFERGLRGEPILEYLRHLKTFTIEQSEKDISQFLSVLPFKAMVPLFVFQLPALIMILFGPLIVNIQESFK